MNIVNGQGKKEGVLIPEKLDITFPSLYIALNS